jgi:hypothetical protein
MGDWNKKARKISFFQKSGQIEAIWNEKRQDRTLKSEME